DLLVGDDSAHEQNIRPGIVKLIGEPSIWRSIEVRKVRYYRQHGGPWKTYGFQILPVQFLSTQWQVAPVHVLPHFAPPVKAFTGERPAYADKVLRRGNVVIDQSHSIWERERGTGSLRAKRKMVEQELVGTTEVDQLPIV